MVFSSYIKTQVKTLSCIISVAMTLGSIILISEDKEKAIIVDNSLEYIADLTLRRETILFYYERRNCHESIKGNTAQNPPDGFALNLRTYFPSSCTEIS